MLYCWTITTGVLYCWLLKVLHLLLNYYYRCCFIELCPQVLCCIVELLLQVLYCIVELLPEVYCWTNTTGVAFIVELLPLVLYCWTITVGVVLYCWTITTGVVLLNYYHRCCTVKLLPQVLYCTVELLPQVSWRCWHCSLFILRTSSAVTYRSSSSNAPGDSQSINQSIDRSTGSVYQSIHPYMCV